MIRALTHPAILSIFALAGLAGCASPGRPIESYNATVDRLTAECQARGGILTPTGGTTGRAETDNVCRISGGASHLTRN